MALSTKWYNIFGTTDGGSIVLSHAGNFTDNPDFTLGRDSMVIFNPAMDTTLPFIASNVPLDGASTVGLTDSVRITFSEPVKKSGVSYTFLPNPGTVVYFGYGNVSQRPDLAGRTSLGAVRSDFFLKLSYLWRMRG